MDDKSEIWRRVGVWARGGEASAGKLICRGGIVSPAATHMHASVVCAADLQRGEG